MTVRVINADVLEGLRQLDDESVHCCVTSPPYFGLRDYGIEGQIGLEATPEAFVARLVEVFRDVRRVLRADGTCWLNLGDSYANDGKWGGSSGGKHVTALHGDTGVGRGKRDTGLKPKDLIGIPWRVAFALQADGWWLRQDIIWNKPNPMPESVTDRCTKAHEYIFLLTKSERYFYDAETIKERADFGVPNSPQSIKYPYGQGFTRRASALDDRARPPNSRPQSGMTRNFRKAGNKTHKYVDKYESDDGELHRTKAGLMKVADTEWQSRNKRSVWTIATCPYPDAHFATFPPELPEMCIKAGCPDGGTVLDPFGGAGTAGMVADRLGRHAVMIELNPEYAKMIKRRIARDRLERKAGTMADVAEAALEPTPLEALMTGAVE